MISRHADQEARMEKGMHAFRILAGTLTGKTPLERLWRRCDENIRTVIMEIGVNTRYFIYSALDKDYWRSLVIAALIRNKIKEKNA